LRLVALIGVVAASLALAGVGHAAAREPWDAASDAQRALSDAETALVLAEPATVHADLDRAESAANELLAGRPAELAVARKAFADARSAATAGDARGLAAARAAVWGAVLRASFGEATAATARGDVAQARAWLLVREFQPPTRFTRAAADATVALDGLAAGTLRPGAAASAVRADLLGTYDNRLRAALAAVTETGKSGFPVRRAEEASAASGYWRILRGSYAAQRDPAAARRVDAAFVSVVAAADAGRGDPAALRRIDDALESFRAVPLSPEERVHRAGQLQRFLELVPIEYDRGVEDGRVTLDFEIQEAITFRDAASSALADLVPFLLRRDPQATRAAVQLVAGLGDSLADATRGRAVADPEAVRAATKEALDSASAAFPEGWGDAKGTADFDVIKAALDRVQAAAAAGEWGAAEQARLEAYGIFELGPEQRLRGLAPSLFQSIEGLFWYGDGGSDGLVQLVKRKAAANEIAATRAALDDKLGEAETRIGEGLGSRTAVVVNSSIIVFREGLEAVLILAALMASMVGAQRRLRRPLLGGVLVALVASAITWVVAQTVLGSLAGWGERLEAVVSLVAIGVLLLILNWFYHRVYWQENLQDLHRKKKRVLRGASVGILSAQALGLVALGFSSVYREGFETVLFLQALTLEAGAMTVLQGVALGFAGVVGVFLLVIALERKLPHKRMLVATGVLITAVLVALVGQTVQTMQAVGWLPVSPAAVELPYWSGVWLGVYPTWEGLTAQAAAAIFVVGSYLVAEALRARKRRRLIASVATPAVSAADLPGEVGELRFEELLPRQANGFRRAGHRDDDRPAVRAGSRAGEHRRRADLLEAEHAEELAEPRERLLEQRGEGVVRGVAS
jgi:high-affinity iron transporter